MWRSFCSKPASNFLVSCLENFEQIRLIASTVACVHIVLKARFVENERLKIVGTAKSYHDMIIYIKIKSFVENNTLRKSTRNRNEFDQNK